MMIKFKVCCFSVMELMNQFSVRARFFQKTKKKMSQGAQPDLIGRTNWKEAHYFYLFLTLGR